MYEVLVSNYFAKQVKRPAKKNHQLKENLSINEVSKHLEMVKSELASLL